MAVPAPPSNWITISDLRRGRNGADPPHSLSDNECVDAVNVDWYKATLGRKRAGSSVMPMTGSTFTGTVSALGRHIPTSDSTLQELWATDDAATPHINRLAGGTTWAAPTLKDVPTGNGWDFSMASSSGKFFLAYQSAVDRLHCWDGTTVRRTGLDIPGVPLPSNTGSGSYTAVLRYYRVRFTTQVGGITIRRSEGSTGVAFTPSGAGTGVVIMEPAAINEGETHWEIEVSLDNATFFLLTTLPIGTTTYTDTAASTTYSNNLVTASAGTYTTQKSYRFIAVDQNRLLGFGSYAAGDKQNRIEISDIVGVLNVGDNERVPLNSYLDLDENDSGAATGLVGPVLGAYFAFKETQTWRLVPSGQPTSPYTQTAISKTVGAVGPHAMTIGEDEFGNPAIYWLSQRSIYRYGSNGLEYIGGGVSDLLVGPTSMINLAANKIIAHALYYSRYRQVRFWVSVGAENEPQSTNLVYSVGRYGGFLAATTSQLPSGWSRFTGGVANARSAIGFSNTVGSPMSKDTRPYIAYSGAVNTIWQLDTASLTDVGTPYQAFVTTKAYFPWGLARRGFINRSYMLAQASPGVTITQTLTGDFGVQTSFDTINLTPSGSETRVHERFEDCRMGDVSFLQFTYGDSAPTANTWQIDQSQSEYFTRETA